MKLSLALMTFAIIATAIISTATVAKADCAAERAASLGYSATPPGYNSAGDQAWARQEAARRHEAELEIKKARQHAKKHR